MYNGKTNWDELEDAAIKNAYTADAPILEIAEFLHRTPDAVRVRACRIKAERAKDSVPDIIAYRGECANCGKVHTVKWAQNMTSDERDRLATLICGCKQTEMPVEAPGACRFCGQIEAVSCTAATTQLEKDEIATLNCCCVQARVYATQQQQADNAKDKIRRLFGDEAGDNGFTPISRDAVIELMDTAVTLMSRHDIRSITVEITSRVKAKISVNAKGKIAVERTDTAKSRLDE